MVNGGKSAQARCKSRRLGELGKLAAWQRACAEHESSRAVFLEIARAVVACAAVTTGYLGGQNMRISRAQNLSRNHWRRPIRKG
jgi:hypothetical protein